MSSYMKDMKRNMNTLAHYMATGEVNGYLLSNARNIALNLKPKKDLVNKGSQDTLNMRSYNSLLIDEIVAKSYENIYH